MLCYENQMNGGSCGVLMLQTCKNWQLESLAKLPPLLDVSGVGVYLTKYILRGEIAWSIKGSMILCLFIITCD